LELALQLPFDFSPTFSVATGFKQKIFYLFVSVCDEQGIATNETKQLPYFECMVDHWGMLYSFLSTFRPHFP